MSTSKSKASAPFEWSKLRIEHGAEESPDGDNQGVPVTINVMKNGKLTGEIAELLPPRAIQEVVESCAKLQAKLADTAPLGCGMMGCVYPAKGKAEEVIKFTFEGPEAALALAFQQMKRQGKLPSVLPRVSKVHLVRACGMPYPDAPLFAYQREDLTDLRALPWQEVVEDRANFDDYIEDVTSVMQSPKALAQLAHAYVARSSAKLGGKLGAAVSRAWQELHELYRDHGIVIDDLGVSNLGVRAAGAGGGEPQIVVRDFGFSTIHPATWNFIESSAPPTMLAALSSAWWPNPAGAGVDVDVG